MRAPDPPDLPTPRRRFLARLTLSLSAVAASVVAFPAAAFTLSNLFRRVTQQWRDVGPVSRFIVGETVEVTFQTAGSDPWSRESGRAGAWLNRDAADNFTAFSMHCTHMGCPVRWRPDASLFLCPCHGGVYNADGSVAAGPPERPLPRYAVRIRNARLEIRTDDIAMG